MNKYNARKTIYNGIKFDSQLEARVYRAIEELKNEGYINFVERQVKYELLEKYVNVAGDKIRSINYFADFVIIDNKNKKYIIDVKGMITPLFKIKKKLFEYNNNEVIHIITSIKSLKKLLNIQ